MLPIAETAESPRQRYQWNEMERKKTAVRRALSLFLDRVSGVAREIKFYHASSPLDGGGSRAWDTQDEAEPWWKPCSWSRHHDDKGNLILCREKPVWVKSKEVGIDRSSGSNLMKLELTFPQ